MPIDLIKTIKQAFGVDLDEMVAEYLPALQGGLDDGYENELMALAVFASFSTNTVMCLSALRLAFAAGYKAGRAAPDLSVFEDALK